MNGEGQLPPRHTIVVGQFQVLSGYYSKVQLRD